MHTSAGTCTHTYIDTHTTTTAQLYTKPSLANSKPSSHPTSGRLFRDRHQTRDEPIRPFHEIIYLAWTMKTSRFLGVRAIEYKSKVNGNHNFCHVKTAVCHRKERNRAKASWGGGGRKRERDWILAELSPLSLVPGSKAAHFFLKLLLQTLSWLQSFQESLSFFFNLSYFELSFSHLQPEESRLIHREIILSSFYK